MKFNVFILILALLTSQCRDIQIYKYEPWSYQFDSDYNSLFDPNFVNNDSLTTQLSNFLGEEVHISKIIKELHCQGKRLELIMTTMEDGVLVFLVCRNNENKVIDVKEVAAEYEEYLKAFYWEKGLCYCKEMDFERFDITGTMDSIAIKSYRELKVTLDENSKIGFDTIREGFPYFMSLRENTRIKFPNFD